MGFHNQFLSKKHRAVVTGEKALWYALVPLVTQRQVSDGTATRGRPLAACCPAQSISPFPPTASLTHRRFFLGDMNPQSHWDFEVILFLQHTLAYPDSYPSSLVSERWFKQKKVTLPMESPNTIESSMGANVGCEIYNRSSIVRVFT